MDSDQAHGASTDSVRVELSLWGSSGHLEPEVRSLLVPAGTAVDGLLEYLSTLLDCDLKAETASGGSRFLAINGAYCAMPRDLARELKDGDSIALMPFLAGG